MSAILYDFTKQDSAGVCSTQQAWAKAPPQLSPDQRREQKARAAELLKAHDAVLVAHYYVDGDLQDLALDYALRAAANCLIADRLLSMAKE